MVETLCPSTASTQKVPTFARNWGSITHPIIFSLKRKGGFENLSKRVRWICGQKFPIFVLAPYLDIAPLRSSSMVTSIKKSFWELRNEASHAIPAPSPQNPFTVDCKTLVSNVSKDRNCLVWILQNFVTDVMLRIYFSSRTQKWPKLNKSKNINCVLWANKGYYFKAKIWGSYSQLFMYWRRFVTEIEVVIGSAAAISRLLSISNGYCATWEDLA